MPSFRIKVQSKKRVLCGINPSRIGKVESEDFSLAPQYRYSSMVSPMTFSAVTPECRKKGCGETEVPPSQPKREIIDLKVLSNAGLVFSSLAWRIILARFDKAKVTLCSGESKGGNNSIHYEDTARPSWDTLLSDHQHLEYL